MTGPAGSMFAFHCRSEETPRKIFEATLLPPSGLCFCLITPSGKKWFVKIDPDAKRMS